MAHTSPTRAHQQHLSPPFVWLPVQPPTAPPVATKEEAPSTHKKTEPSFEVEKIPETSKIPKLSSFERKAFKEFILLVQEALENHEFSATRSIPKLTVEGSRGKVSIWGVPLLEDDRTDAILLKFLEAKNFNVGESFTMLKNTIGWRREFDIDGLMEQTDQGDDLQKVVYVHGQDRDGHPVCYNMYGEFQNKQLYMNTFADEEKRKSFVRRIIQMLERSIRKLDFSARGVSTLLIVVDLKNSPGPGKKELWIACDQLHQLLQENYPEIVEKQVLDHLSIHVTAYLLGGARYISPENLPIQYGGLNGRYPHIRNPEFTADDVATEIIIKPLTQQTVEIFLHQGCIISWELRVLDWGVSYSATFLPGAKHPYTIILDKKKKMACVDEDAVANKFEAGEPGKIVLTIDNPTSKRKRLIYRFKVKPVQD
ncbi:Patellin-3 [Sesamum angolense]|uniref:Patellin-3 n=1 Tax=Sesamum angolense TaxID=2727404 RepID=A0AAE1WDA5_9LAMI|nr:Patellin-3 [Sesamum angolense]